MTLLSLRLVGSVSTPSDELINRDSICYRHAHVKYSTATESALPWSILWESLQTWGMHLGFAEQLAAAGFPWWQSPKFLMAKIPNWNMYLFMYVFIEGFCFIALLTAQPGFPPSFSLGQVKHHTGLANNTNHSNISLRRTYRIHNNNIHNHTSQFLKIVCLILMLPLCTIAHTARTCRYRRPFLVSFFNTRLQKKRR